MAQSRLTGSIRCEARLRQPEAGRGGWTFLVLPAAASAKLPTRGQVPVEGTLGGIAFEAVMEPDGRRSHWLKVSRRLRESAGAQVGDVVALELRPATNPPEARVPPDLRKSLSAAPDARAIWSSLTPAARRDWIHWIVSAKRPETRARRIANACDMLASGKRRVCCFDRSGFYSKEFGAPVEAAEPGTYR